MADRDPFRALGGVELDDEEERQDPFTALGAVPEPEPATQAPQQGVRVVGQDGTVATLSPDQADIAIAQGARPFEEVAKERREADLQAEYGGAANQALAGAQGGLRGLSFGLSDAASAALTGALTPEGPQLAPEARARIEALNRTRAPDQQIALPEDKSAFQTGYGAAREYQRGLQEANPITAGASEVGGALLGGGAALARGGASALLGATPAGLAARAATGIAGLGGESALGRIAATAAGGAVEGAIAGAGQQIADAVPQFSVDPREAAEHILAGAGEGMLYGAALGGGLQAVGEGARALSSSSLARGAAKLAQGVVPDLSPQGMREIAYESAAKAAIGRTNIAAVRDANRLEGGVRGVGKSLLEDGVVARGDDVESIFQKAEGAAERYGQQIDGLVGQLDQAGVAPETASIAAKIRADAIDPLLASPSTRARGKALAAHFDDLLTELDQGTGPFTSYRGVWEERRRLDDEIRAAFRSQSPVADGIKNVRRAFEDGFSELAESTAGPEWRQAYKAAKSRYSHMRFAADESWKAIESKLSNRWFSPSDYGMAGAGLIAGDPLSGIAMGLANKAVRERGRATVAAGMNWLASVADAAQQKTALVGLTNSAQEQIGRAAQSLATATKRGAYAAEGAAISKWTHQDMLDAVAEARELQDPNSEISAHLAQTAQQLDQINPGMGMAYAQAAHARGKLITDLLPKPPSNAIFAPPPAVDPVTDRKIRHTVEASMRPQKALERIAMGVDRPEDKKAMETLYPAMWKRFQGQVQAELKRLKRPPPLETRLRIAIATGLATDPTMEPDALQTLQQIATMPSQAAQAEAKQEKHEVQQDVAGSFKTFDANAVYSGPVDARLDQR